MASLPIEIVDLRSDQDSLVADAIAAANECQSAFAFQYLDDRLVDDLALLARQDFHTGTYFDALQARRQDWRGYHPFIITVTDSPLRSDDWANLFSSGRGSTGLAVLTTCDVAGVILPHEELRAYCIYELAAHALAFIVSGKKCHPETSDCVYDFQEDKTGIRKSMRTGRVCDPCRQWFIDNGKNLSSDQLSSFESLLKKVTDEMTTTPRKPRVFVGSSVEGLDVARAIQSELNYDYHVELWNQSDVFRLGTATLEALENALDAYDYAIFVFTPDDQITKRGDTTNIARDNVIFEAGLFIGSKGRFNAFIVHPRDHEIQLPSDLLGIGTAKYEANAPNIAASVGAACGEIRAAVH